MTRFVMMRDGPCDLDGPHDENAVGKSAAVMRVRNHIKNAGGDEVHLCYACKNAWLTEERRNLRFSDASE